MSIASLIYDYYNVVILTGDGLNYLLVFFFSDLSY